MRRMRRIKILATLGPVSSDSAMIRRLFEAGADIFRINMSHTPHDKMRELVATIRNVESSYGRPIGILVDLQGPKLRLGSFADGAVQLNNGQSFVLDSDKTPGDNTRVLTIDLPNQKVIRANGENFHFDINPTSKHQLVEGLDEIGQTLQKVGDIEKAVGQ